MAGSHQQAFSTGKDKNTEQQSDPLSKGTISTRQLQFTQDKMKSFPLELPASLLCGIHDGIYVLLSYP